MKVCRDCGIEGDWPARMGLRCPEHFREHRRKMYRESMKDPVRKARLNETRLAASKRWRKKHPEDYKRSQRKTLKRLRNDPERYSKYLEDRRIRERIRREQAGIRSIPQRGNHHHRFKVVNPNSTVNAEPLKEWLLSIRFRYETISEIADRFGVHESYIRKILNGKITSVEIDSVDRICVKAGLGTYTALYPELGEAA